MAHLCLLSEELSGHRNPSKCWINWGGGCLAGVGYTQTCICRTSKNMLLLSPLRSWRAGMVHYVCGLNP